MAETNPASLDELFNRDPLLLGQGDLKAIVKYFREKREQWKVAEATPKTKALPKAAKGTLSLEALRGTLKL